MEERRTPPKTVLFIEQTPMGELGRRLRELMNRLAPILGFTVKIVERNGSSLKSHFPQSSLWDGAPCGRTTCITCTQGAEVLPPCTRKSLVYENVCSTCNPGAGAKRELEGVDPNIPSIYVGETSRTIQERAKEHWSAARDGKKKDGRSHMKEHMEQYHSGEDPTFIMRVVQYYKTALSRQTGEAVRIMRRGGAGSVLNSRSEFNRCYIPRLRVEDQEKIRELEAMEEEELNSIKVSLMEEDSVWEQGKSVRRAEGIRSTLVPGSSVKREGVEQGAGRRRKRLKFDIVEDDWGALKTTPGPATTMDDGGSKSRCKGANTITVNQQEDMGAQPTLRLVSGAAAPPPPPSLEIGEEGLGSSTLSKGAGNQLLSPRCDVQTRIKEYFKQQEFDSSVRREECDNLVEGGVVEIVTSTDTTMSDPRKPEIVTSDTGFQSHTAPSMGISGVQQQMNKEEGCNDDILREGGPNIKNDCDINKRKLWCNKHECDVKTYDVSSTKWQWSNKKKEYMNVRKKNKKYVCLFMRRVQVQPMVAEIVGSEQTMPGNLGTVREGCNDDYTLVGPIIRDSDCDTDRVKVQTDN